MPNPAELSPSAVGTQVPELRAAVVHEDATTPGQEVKCIIPSFGIEWTSDPVQWTPYTTDAGTFYPKRDDRAVLGYPPDGPPVILEWWPAEDAAPDKPKPTLRVPFNLDLFGPESRSAHALAGDKSVTTFGLFPGDAFTSSTQFLAHQVTGTVEYALWDVAYNPEGGKDCGIQLVSFKGNPEGVFNPIAEWTGDTSRNDKGELVSTPVHKQSNITSEIAELWEEAREGGDAKFLGHRLRANVSPSVAPLVFMSRIAMVLAPA